MWLVAIMAGIFSPFIALLGALFRGVVLFWPTMLVLGAVHSYVPGVPALGWQAVFWIVALLSLLIPTGSSVKTD